MNKIVYANDVDYWKTGSTRSPAQWIDLAEKQLRDHGAKDILVATGESGGRKAYMIQFTLSGDRHKLVWPVLPLRDNFMSSHQLAAERQAATSLYHDVKARCVAATRYGNEFGFFQFRLLPDGRTIQECSLPELSKGLPALMAPSARLLEAPA